MENNVNRQIIKEIIINNKKKILKMLKSALNTTKINFNNLKHKEQVEEIVYILLPFYIKTNFKKIDFKLNNNELNLIN